MFIYQEKETGLVICFDDISTFVAYLMPKPSSSKKTEGDLFNL